MDSEAKKILELIENVDPSDTDKLDEIDARVWCWLNGKKFQELMPEMNIQKNNNIVMFGYSPNIIQHTYKYTRSRDALKDIRPEGYSFTTSPRFCTARNHKAVRWADDNFLEILDQPQPYETPYGVEFFETPMLPTEELAELYAIIQAIEYERKDNEN